MEGPWVFLFLLGALSLQNFMIQPAQGSTKNDDCGLITKRVEDLEMKLERLEQLEVEVEKLKEALKDKQEIIVNNDTPRSIEDDVLQNTKDIMVNTMDINHNNHLIHQGMVDTVALNLTLNNEIDEIKTETEQTRPPIGSIIAWMPTFSQTKDIPNGWQRCDGSTIMT